MQVMLQNKETLMSLMSAPRYRMHKFRDWLLSGIALDIKPNVYGLEVLSYLAYETVAQVCNTHIGM